MNQGPILAATDLTARSDRAVDRAFLLADQLSRSVWVVHVVESEREGATAEIEKKVRETLPEGNSEIRVVIPAGAVAGEIARVAEEGGATLICVGPARFNSLCDFFLGTAVDYIAREADCPLLVVKERARRPYESIVFATDFSDNSRQALEKAASLFPGARFHLIHAFHIPYAAWNRDEYVGEELRGEERGRMDEFIASLSPELDERVDGRVACGNLFQGIYEAAAEHGANLVAFGTHGESGFRHATIGSVANELLTNLTLDSLIVRP